MKVAIFSVFALTACASLPVKECETHLVNNELLPYYNHCNDRDRAKQPEKPRPVIKETRPEPVWNHEPTPEPEPKPDLEPDRLTDPAAHKAWKERHTQTQGNTNV